MERRFPVISMCSRRTGTDPTWCRHMNLKCPNYAGKTAHRHYSFLGRITIWTIVTVGRFSWCKYNSPPRAVSWANFWFRTFTILESADSWAVLHSEKFLAVAKPEAILLWWNTNPCEFTAYVSILLSNTKNENWALMVSATLSYLIRIFESSKIGRCVIYGTGIRGEISCMLFPKINVSPLSDRYVSSIHRSQTVPYLVPGLEWSSRHFASITVATVENTSLHISCL